MKMILEVGLPFCTQVGRMTTALAAAERKHALSQVLFVWA